MEDIQEIAKMYLDWWESCWEQTLLSGYSMGDSPQVWSSLAKVYEDAVKDSTAQMWKF